MTCIITLNPGSTSFINVFVRERSIDSVTRDEVLTPVNTATVTVTIKDKDGVDITGVTFPLAVPFDANGSYSGTIPSALNIINGEPVDVFIDVTDSGRDYEAEQEVFPSIPELCL